MITQLEFDLLKVVEKHLGDCADAQLVRRFIEEHPLKEVHEELSNLVKFALELELQNHAYAQEYRREILNAVKEATPHDSLTLFKLMPTEFRQKPEVANYLIKLLL